MSRIAILYATREGHTAKISHRIAAAFRTHGHEAEVFEVRSIPPDFNLSRFDAAVLGASVHAGTHEHEMIEFVRARKPWLVRMPTAFLSVSLSEGTVEDELASTEARAKARADVQRVLDRFFEAVEFRPTYPLPVAGALLYSHYGLVTRLLMRWISKRSGGPTDTSHDYEFTNWDALERFAGEFSRELDVARERALRQHA